MGAPLTQKEYKSKVFALHGNEYIFTSKFKGTKTLIKAECSKGHLICSPAEYFLKGGKCCSKCKGSNVSKAKAAKGKAAFAGKLKKLAKFADYTLLSDYKGSKTLIKVCCAKGHIYNSKPEYLLQGNGCAKCGVISSALKATLTKEIYAARLEAKYGNKIICIDKYKGIQVKTAHSCLEHGLFLSMPNTLLSKTVIHGCPDCGNESRRIPWKTNVEFKQEIKAKHGNTLHCLHVYKGALAPHKFKCNKGHKWTTTADSVLRISGCPGCNDPLKHSKIAIEWIEKTCKLWNITEVKHATNGGEIVVYGKSGKRYKVDGFVPKHNLIMEFHGDVFHGNPDVFSPTSKPNPWSNLTALELHKATIKREQDLLNAGYAMLVVWESDYKKGDTGHAEFANFQ